jgi:hypothetical protein
LTALQHHDPVGVAPDHQVFVLDRHLGVGEAVTEAEVALLG